MVVDALEVIGVDDEQGAARIEPGADETVERAPVETACQAVGGRKHVELLVGEAELAEAQQVHKAQRSAQKQRQRECGDERGAVQVPVEQAHYDLAESERSKRRNNQKGSGKRQYASPDAAGQIPQANVH